MANGRQIEAAEGAEERTGYHEGELAAQERAQLRGIAARAAGGIRSAVPPVAADFLRQQRFVFVGALDGGGRPWASVLTGPPGFADAPDERALRIDATPVPGDPLARAFRGRDEVSGERSSGASMGIVVVDFATRRRLRANGRGAFGPDGALHIEVDQVYSNCRKYIQARTEVHEEPHRSAVDLRVHRHRGLSEAQRDSIRRADTFIIASAHPTAGVDCSHRGGTPGFVHVDGDRLVWPDYSGNAMLNTLGNITAYPRAGLLFLDFDTGATLQLTGCAAIDWDPSRAAAAPGAQRLVVFQVDEAIEVEHAIPLRFQLIERSPFNPPPWTGSPDERVYGSLCDTGLAATTEHEDER